MKTTRYFSPLLVILATFTLHAQIPYLVKDINPGTPWSSPRLLTKVGQEVFFEAITSAGWGLWKTDGSAQGTTLLKSFGANYEIYNLTAINGTLYFRAHDGTHGYEPWISDGTPAGTVMLKDINPGTASSYASEFLYYNSQVFFVAQDNTNGAAIWTTDGTDAGTLVFKDLAPGSMTGGGAYSFTKMGSDFYFWGNPVAQTSIELWKSDGTAAGTVMVKAFSGFTSPSMKVSNGRLFFAFGGGTTGSQGVWVSDGTTAGTILLKDFNVSLGVGVLEDRMADVNGVMFLAGNDGVNGKELWKSDGTPAGTTLVKNIRSGNVGSSPENLTSFKGLLYFVAIDDNSTTELWKSDGTDAGTVQVEAPYSGSTHPTGLFVYNNTLFFNASQWTGNAGIELWKSDGVNDTLVYDIYPGSNHSSTANHVGVNDKLFFSAQDATHGIEIWALDVANSTGLAEANNAYTVHLYPNPVTGNLFFLPDGNNLSYSIYNLQGGLVQHGELNGNTIMVSGLSPGMYLLTLRDDSGMARAARFVKE
jgi:ELWxxDGT repeat protein